MSLIRRLTPILNCRYLRREVCNRSIHTVILKEANINSTSTLLNLRPVQPVFSIERGKSKKAKYDSDDEDEAFGDDDSSLSKDSKVVKFSTTSMRTDVIIKSALGYARNRVEEIFYESKIRLNGRKIMKKSAAVKLGDEVDVVKMVSPKNPEHLYVSRIEILNIVPKEDSISITARRFKNLLIENYEIDPYKSSSTEEET